MRPFEAAREATAEIGLAVLATTFSPGGHLRAGLVHVVDLRPLPLPVRHHGGGGGAGQPAGVVHAHADDERAAAPRRTDAGGEHDGRPRSRARLLRAGIDRGYAWSLALVDAAPLGAWSCVCARRDRLVRSRSIGWVKQEYMPDRRGRGASSRSSIDGPEGIEPGRHGRGHAGASTDEVRAMPGVRLVLARPRAAASSAASTRATCTCASRPTRSARSRWRRLWRGTASRAIRWRAFRGNYTPARRDAGGPPAPAEVPRPAHPRAQHRRFNIGGGNFDIDFVLRGPDLTTLAELRRAAAHSGPSQLGGIVDADTTLKLDKPELRVEIDRERAADLGVDTEQIATALRLMVGGDEEVSRFRDPVRQRGLRRAAPAERGGPQRPRTISRLYVSRASAVATPHGAAPRSAWRPAAARPARQPGADRARRRRRPASTAPTASARSGCARSVAPGLRPGRPHRRAAAGGGRDEPARRLHHRHLRPRRASWSGPSRVPLGLPALGHLHVHDPGRRSSRAWSTR